MEEAVEFSLHPLQSQIYSWCPADKPLARLLYNGGASSRIEPRPAIPCYNIKQ